MNGRPRRHHDVVALVCGVCFLGLAVVALVDTFVGGVSWAVLKVAAPLVLVAVGAVGLALSRHRP